MRIEGEGSYDCPSCGETIVVPVDVRAGQEQEYVEDCPVCCSPAVLCVHVDDEGSISIVAEAE
jgi:hypothetical protein